MSKTKLLVFDVDGVLCKEDELQMRRLAAQHAYLAEKLGVSIEQAKNAYEAARLMLPKRYQNTSVKVFEAAGGTRQGYMDILNSINHEGAIEPNDNCLSTLEELSKDNRIVTLSNAPRMFSLKTLEMLGVMQHVGGVYAADDFAESKPSVNNLRIVLRKEGFLPQDSYFIGNSSRKDIAPANEAGMITILYKPNGIYRGSIKPAHIIRDLAEIVGIVRGR